VSRLRPVVEVLAEIRELAEREGIVGVQGYSITVRTNLSTLNQKWGELAIKRAKRHTPAPEGAQGGGGEGG
jgi:hypothetical protein